MARKQRDLFGGSTPWQSSEWTSSDDRVRGGKSQSYLHIDPAGATATFKGNLDIKTLGGAGFASQRTKTDEAVWDLGAFDGVEIVLLRGDETRYTFNIKDELLPLDSGGREQSTVSWEFDFELSASVTSGAKTTLWIPWAKFTPTFRGREKKDASALKTHSIRRFGIMCRSFFGGQEGDFTLQIERISAIKCAEDKDKKYGSEKSYVLVDENEESFGRMADSHEGRVDLEKAADAERDVHVRAGTPATWSQLAVLAAVFGTLAYVVRSGYRGQTAVFTRR